MAKVDATTFKAQLATAAAALTTAFQDDTLTELAVEYKPNHHALRRLAKLFILNKSTGVFTANDDYVDAVYAGDTPNQGRLTDGQGVPTPISVASATVEAAQPADIVLTFDFPVFENSATLISLGGDSDPAKSIVGVTYAGTVVTITVDTAYIALATITVSGEFFGSRASIVLADEAVTNNVV